MVGKFHLSGTWAANWDSAIWSAHPRLGISAVWVLSGLGGPQSPEQTPRGAKALRKVEMGPEMGACGGLSYIGFRPAFSFGHTGRVSIELAPKLF